MDAATFAWTIAAMVLAGMQVFSQKIVAHEKRDSAFNGIMGYGLSALIALLGLLFVYAIPANWQVIAFFGLAAGLTHGVGSYIRIESLKRIDAVIFFPINKVLGPVLVVAVGILWFGDALSIREYIGIALSLTVPLLLISAAEKHRQNNLKGGLILLVVSTAITAFSSLLVKEGLDYDASVLFIMALSQAAGAVSSVAIYLKQRSGRVLDLLAHDARDVKLGLINGTLQFFSFLFFLKAISGGLISLVYVIHAHYILIPIVLSIWWYKDHINLRKFAAVVVSFLAISLLYGA